MTPAGSLLVADGLHKAYGTTPALDGAHFSIHPGEVVAVMGPSGSGKSTLLHCLAGIVTPDSGTITYDGRELSAMADRERSALRRGDFGFVFQFGQLVPELTCVENVALPLRLNGAKRKDAEREALKWMARLEVDDLGRKRPGVRAVGARQPRPAKKPVRPPTPRGNPGPRPPTPPCCGPTPTPSSATSTSPARSCARRARTRSGRPASTGSQAPARWWSRPRSGNSSRHRRASFSPSA
ncbi:ATP-binding cassette domain-containing protein [Streptomyces flavidovirens]|uniref:ABC transporter ATP-binding protein n=1 Tax=Streptomyces flavidovirens TaxID=67298 RepID=UPI00341E519F